MVWRSILPTRMRETDMKTRIFVLQAVGKSRTFVCKPKTHIIKTPTRSAVATLVTLIQSRSSRTPRGRPTAYSRLHSDSSANTNTCVVRVWCSCACVCARLCTKYTITRSNRGKPHRGKLLHNFFVTYHTLYINFNINRNCARGRAWGVRVCTPFGTGGVVCSLLC